MAQESNKSLSLLEQLLIQGLGAQNQTPQMTPEQMQTMLSTPAPLNPNLTAFLDANDPMKVAAANLSLRRPKFDTGGNLIDQSPKEPYAKLNELQANGPQRPEVQNRISAMDITRRTGNQTSSQGLIDGVNAQREQQQMKQLGLLEQPAPPQSAPPAAFQPEQFSQPNLNIEVPPLIEGGESGPTWTGPNQIQPATQQNLPVAPAPQPPVSSNQVNPFQQSSLFEQNYQPAQPAQPTAPDYANFVPSFSPAPIINEPITNEGATGLGMHNQFPMPNVPYVPQGNMTPEQMKYLISPNPDITQVAPWVNFTPPPKNPFGRPVPLLQ